jgi:hypothetical protein
MSLASCGSSATGAATTSTTTAQNKQSSNPSSSTTSLSVNPNENFSITVSSSTVSPGATFTVNVLVNTKITSLGAQCGLSFDPSAMQCTGVTEGNFYSGWATSNNLTTLMIPTQPQIDDTKGTVEVTGVSIMGNQGASSSGPTGQGVFLSYNMTANSGVNKTTTLTLSNIMIIDQNTNPISGVTASTVEVTIGTP